MIEKAFASFKVQFDENVLDEEDIYRLRRAAQNLGRVDVVEQVNIWEKDLQGVEKFYNDNYLAKLTTSDIESKRRE